jgi:predicted nucleotidyltransferase
MSKTLDYQFIARLQELPFIDEIWLFGSRARGDHRQKSDIDLAILCNEATDKDWLSVMEIIEDSDTLLKIDCIRFDQNTISKDLYDNILQDKKVIYVKNRN